MNENLERPDDASAPSNEPYLGPPAQAMVTGLTTVVVLLGIMVAVVLYLSWPAIVHFLNCH